MFFRLLLRAATVRRGRALTALFAIAVAATLATALLSVYGDIDAKMSGDFRKFGANVMMTATEGAYFSATEVREVRQSVGPGAIVAPFAYAIAKTKSGQPVVVVGTDFYEVQRLNTSWSVTAWPGKGSALIGSRAALLFEDSPRPSELNFNGRQIRFLRGGTLHTGGDEDSRVYLTMEDFAEWTGLQPSVIEISVPGSTTEVLRTIQRLKTAGFAKFNIQPVRQIVEAETRVLGKTRFILLLSTLAITLTVALCVLSTLTASVLERRKDYAVMKALGSSQAGLNAIFVGETLSLATLGAIVGFAGGTALAIWIGQVNFHTTVAMRPQVFPAVLAGCISVALLSSLIPLTILQKTQPAAMLKGE